MTTTTVFPYRMTDTDLLLDEGARPYILKIRDLPAERKPREKLLAHGPGALGTNELLALLLTTGTKKEDVMGMTARIAREYGEKSIAGQTDARRMAEDLAIPLVKAMQIVACFELGRRFYRKESATAAIIRTAKDVYEHTADMRDFPKEHLRGIYLNAHHRVIHDEVISIGTVNANIVHPREVFRPAISYGAAAVVLVHNHPSGITKPSDADIAVTKQLIETGEIVGIPLLDHVIVTKVRFTSVKAAL